MTCYTLPSEATPHVTFLGDFVYMKRTSLHNHSLVKNPNKKQDPCKKCPNHTVIGTEDLIHDFDFEPGYRVAMIYTPSARNSIEANFMDLQTWHGDKSAHGNQDLSFPFSHAGYSSDFTNADKAHAEYESSFWDVELNYWRHFSAWPINYVDTTGKNDSEKEDSFQFTLSGVAGFRYFHLDESFKLSMENPPDKSKYTIHTWNKAYGAQVGLDFQMIPMPWLCWDLFAKVGIFGNDTKQKQFLGDLDDAITLRHSKDHDWQCGFFTDVAASIEFRIPKSFSIHGGYQAIFMTGLSLAPEQVSHGTDSDAGKKDRVNGNAIIHGLFVGLSLSF